jgi:hypothetical protein
MPSARAYGPEALLPWIGSRFQGRSGGLLQSAISTCGPSKAQRSKSPYMLRPSRACWGRRERAAKEGSSRWLCHGDIQDHVPVRTEPRTILGLGRSTVSSKPHCG